MVTLLLTETCSYPPYDVPMTAPPKIPHPNYQVEVSCDDV